jgi:hypothetical protein
MSRSGFHRGFWVYFCSEPFTSEVFLFFLFLEPVPLYRTEPGGVPPPAAGEVHPDPGEAHRHLHHRQSVPALLVDL